MGLLHRSFGHWMRVATTAKFHPKFPRRRWACRLVCKSWKQCLDESNVLDAKRDRAQRDSAFERLWRLEEKYPISDYVHNQTDVNDKMRTVLVDWLVDVVWEYKYC